MRTFTKKQWLLLAAWAFLILPTASFLLVSATLIAYMYWPKTFGDIDFSQFTPRNSHMLVLVHGVKDSPSTWVNPLKSLYQQTGYQAQIEAVDWSDYARGTLRCAIDGKRIGRAIGEHIAAGQNIDSVHLIGHSCGAFVVYGACQTIKQRRPNIKVQTTYLDPVSVYGLLWDYGIDHFGDCADYSEAYIDTGDGVPGSNQLLPHCHTYDVTPVRLRLNGDSIPHMWPVHYYRQLVASGNAPEFHRDASIARGKPVGELEVVE